MAHRSLAVRQKVHRPGERPLGKRQKNGRSFLLRGRQRRGQFAKGLRLTAGRKMIGVVLRLILLMQMSQSRPRQNPRSRYRSCPSAGRQNWQARQKNECLDHVELRRFRMAAVAQHNAGPENGFRGVREQHSRHVFAKFFGARIRIVIRAVPIDGMIFGDHFVAALPRYGDRADFAEAAQAVIVLRMARQQLELRACRASLRSDSSFPTCGSATRRNGSPNRWCAPAGHTHRDPSPKPDEVRSPQKMRILV